MALTLTNVFTKTTRDRWKATVIGAVTLALLLVFGMSVYRDIDVAFWDDLPDAFRNMFGIPAGADVGGLAYGAIYSGYGMLTMAAIALAAVPDDVPEGPVLGRVLVARSVIAKPTQCKPSARQRQHRPAIS